MDKKPDHELKKNLLAIRLTDREYLELQERAMAAGLKPGRLAVHAALHLEITPPVPAINRKIYSDLARVGANLNQIAARLNRESKLSAGDLIATLRDLHQHLAATRKQLIGAKS